MILRRENDPHQARCVPNALKEGHDRVTIYWQANASRRRNPATNEREITAKVFDEYLLGYYHGTEQVVDKQTCKPVLDEATGQPKLDRKGKPMLHLSTGRSQAVPKFIRKKSGNLANAELRQIFAACFQPSSSAASNAPARNWPPTLPSPPSPACAQEIKRPYWAEVPLTGPERDIEVKASESKTSFRRLVPVTDNLAACAQGETLLDAGPLIHATASSR